LVRASGDLSGSRKRLDRCGIGSFQKSRTRKFMEAAPKHRISDKMRRMRRYAGRSSLTC
jgi:hypothetical protein